VNRRGADRLSRVAIALCLVVLSACGSEGDSKDPAAKPCPSPSPSGDPALLPRSLPLERWGTIVTVEERGGFVGAEALTQTLIVELYPDIVRTLTENGYTLLGGDNEGFEAEISFIDRKESNVNFTLRQTGCKGEVSVFVLIEERGSA
jgi:hypothetical protein